MKKVYILAYMKNNLGDDLFIRTLVRRYPETRFYINPETGCSAGFEAEPNLRIASAGRRLVLRLIRRGLNNNSDSIDSFDPRLRCADALVHIGGSICIEPENWNGSFTRLLNKNSLIIGANFGPYKTEKYKSAVEGYIRQARDCCFRDQYSYDSFASLPMVRWAPDVLFGCSMPAAQSGSGIGISVIRPDNRAYLKEHAGRYYETLASLCDLCAAQDIPVTLFSFCEKEGDEIAIEKIIQQAKHPEKIGKCLYNGDIDAVLSAMNGCKALVASRFHAMILGWLMQKNVVPVIYSRKQTNVLEDIAYAGGIWDMLSGEGCTAENLMKMCDQNPLPGNLQGCIDGSFAQFEALDRLLGRA